ncbi:UNVERIFIED_CONTAM: hypothetical protein HDU68_002557, partial [Siphonaria sp. JEL0065]
GLGQYYVSTTDESVRSQIATILRASGASNFKGCDSNWYCIRNLPVGSGMTMQNGTNPRDQFETVSILNSLAVINGAKASVSQPVATTTTKSGAFVSGGLGVLGVVLVALMA